jgi:hypothetical protein
MKIVYIYKNEETKRKKEISKIFKYFEPLTRDFHVRTHKGTNSCESISIYRGGYGIHANNLSHPYHRIS